MVSSETPWVYHGAALRHINDQREPKRRYVGVFVCKRHQGKCWTPGSLTFDLYEHSNTQAAETAVGLVYTVMRGWFWVIVDRALIYWHTHHHVHARTTKTFKMTLNTYLTLLLICAFWSDLTHCKKKKINCIFWAWNSNLCWFNLKI